MRTTLNIDQELLEKARQLSGSATKTETVERGLEALVAQAAARRLAALAGKHPEIRQVERRRPKRNR